MTTFQLDECLNDRTFADRCNAEAVGETQTFRYPRRLKGEDDPAVLADLLPRGNPLVTTDRAMPEQHGEHIRIPHPGIVIVCHSPDEPRTITASRAAAILARVKSSVPDWHRLPLANSIVFLTEVDVEVCCVQSGSLVHGRHLSYTDPNWPADLTADLAMNAARSSVSAP